LISRRSSCPLKSFYLGSKKSCDQDNLKLFNALKARVVNHLGKVGVRFLRGWAIPDALLKSLHEVLLDIKITSSKPRIISSTITIWLSKTGLTSIPAGRG
jgi:hypothetical protein